MGLCPFSDLLLASNLILINACNPIFTMYFLDAIYSIKQRQMNAWPYYFAIYTCIKALENA
jgi:hypothetical protein